MELAGRCLCGQVTYACDAEALACAVCHCEDCQRQTGTAFSVLVAVPAAELSVEGETLAAHTTHADADGAPRERRFCSACGSPIVTLLSELPDVALIKAGTLDDRTWLDPSVEIWCASAQPWVRLAGERRRVPGDGMGLG